MVGKNILQDLFEGTDLKQLRVQLKLDNSTSFERVIASLFYFEDKQQLIDNLSQKLKVILSMFFSY